MKTIVVKVLGKLIKATKLGTAVLIVAALVGACSGSDEKPEGTSIKEGTDAIAEKGIQAIKTPLDQAKRAKALTEQHNRAIEEGTKQ